MSDESNRQNVVVTDIRMPFFSMVVFMVKWSIAAIPAFFIITVFGVLTWGMLSGLLFSMTIGKKGEAIHATGIQGPSAPPASGNSPTPPAAFLSHAPSHTTPAHASNDRLLPESVILGVDLRSNEDTPVIEWSLAPAERNVER